jgi:hypothetical protein
MKIRYLSINTILETHDERRGIMLVMGNAIAISKWIASISTKCSGVEQVYGDEVFWVDTTSLDLPRKQQIALSLTMNWRNHVEVV